MKKTILYLLTGLVILSSCEKEDDILNPIPTNPTTQTTTTNTTDTLIVNGDTIVTNNGTGNETELLNEGLVIDNGTSNGGVTILTPINTFRGAGKNYNVKSAEFSVNCSELTNQHFDTSYSYVTTNWAGAQIGGVPGYQNGIGNGIIQFSQFQTNGYPLNNGVEGYFYTTTYPMNGNASPCHAYYFSEMWFLANIVSYSYTPGVITLNLVYHPCNGPDVYWSAEMVVTEYSDGTIALSIDEGPHNFVGITWNSHLKLILEEE